MATRLTYEQKKEQAVVDLINEMFKIAGHEVTYSDVVGRTDNWYSDWTMTEDQYEQWQKWGISYLIKNLKMTSGGAKKEMSMVGLMWGLKFDTSISKS
jgi:hypothetical protein